MRVWCVLPMMACLAIAAPGSTSRAWTAGPAQEGTRLILLGTRGGPRVSLAGPANAATLLLVDGTPYLIDCGYGTTRQLLAAGVAPDRVRYIFITHHHSDHNLDLGPVIYNGWVAGASGPVDVYGPPGLSGMLEAFFQSMKQDIDVRIVDEGRSDLRQAVHGHDVAGPGLVLDNGTVRVTAARVVHPMVEHAYAYRFDTRTRSVVVSGDTTYAPALVELARGADVLVHEVLHPAGVEGLARRVPGAARLRAHLVASHTVPEDVGRVAAQAGVKTLVLSHFVPADDPSLTDADWTAGVRKHFGGRIVVGKDLMEVR